MPLLFSLSKKEVLSIGDTLFIFLVAFILLALGILNKNKLVIIFATIPFLFVIVTVVTWFIVGK